MVRNTLEPNGGFLPRKGSTSSCLSYRSLLVSSIIGKVFHRAVRQHGATLYAAFLQPQQVEGDAKSLCNWLFIRDRNVSFGALFLDLTEAFYRIMQKISLGGTPTNETIPKVMKRLNMPSTAMHELHALLQEPSALCQAGRSQTARRSIAAIHSNTHFWLPGQHDLAQTCMGTRPGDCFADVIYLGTLGVWCFENLKPTCWSKTWQDHCAGVPPCPSSSSSMNRPQVTRIMRTLGRLGWTI